MLLASEFECSALAEKHGSESTKQLWKILKKRFSVLASNKAVGNRAMMSKIQVTLLTGRTIDQGTSKEYGKLSAKYKESVAICEIDPDDMKELAIKEDSNVRISTEQGSVIVTAKDSKRGPHPRVVYMPYGYWANLLIDSSTDGTGMPTFKGITAQVEPAPGSRVLDLRELLKLTFRKE